MYGPRPPQNCMSHGCALRAARCKTNERCFARQSAQGRRCNQTAILHAIKLQYCMLHRSKTDRSTAAKLNPSCCGNDSPPSPTKSAFCKAACCKAAIGNVPTCDAVRLCKEGMAFLHAAYVSGFLVPGQWWARTHAEGLRIYSAL